MRLCYSIQTLFWMFWVKFNDTVMLLVISLVVKRHTLFIWMDSDPILNPITREVILTMPSSFHYRSGINPATLMVQLPHQ